MKVSNLVLFSVLLVGAIATGKYLATKRHVVTPIHLSAGNEDAYRTCLRDKAGVVGVYNLSQMKACTKETGYQEPQT